MALSNTLLWTFLRCLYSNAYLLDYRASLLVKSPDNDKVFLSTKLTSLALLSIRLTPTFLAPTSLVLDKQGRIPYP
nr:hypothetical protein Q903MT_gene593 [Picea sitchensis]